MSNIVFVPDSEAASIGCGSLIVSPDGRILDQLEGNVEGIVEAVIPIAEFREGRTIPHYPLEVAGAGV